MKILHTYCLNYNIGDYALGMGVKNLLRDHLSVDFIGETNIQGRVFDEYYINEVVNKKYDLLVIGGGGIIHGSHWPNGWFWLIEKNLIKTIKIPFIVYGIGNNYFEGESIPARTINHLRETKKYASYFSVRNDGSYDRVVRQLGFKPYEVPDPGFHVGLNTKFERPINEDYVVIQLANDKTDQRFVSRSKAGFINSLREAVAIIAKNYKVIFIPHVFDDVSISNEIADGIDNTKVLKFGDFAFDHCDKLIAYYKYARFVISMRGHGQIIPISFNVPIISLQNHPKHIGLMKKLGLLEYNVDIKRTDFEIILKETLEKIEINRTDLITKYRQINKKLLADSKKAMLLIRENLNE